VKPPRLRPGALIGLVAPAGRLDRESQVEDTIRELDALGFRARAGRHVLARHGYLAGSDEQRAEDLMAMFLDDEVDAVLALRGGWGCARMLPLLDYDAIRAHPKPLIGYSDITALLLAVYARSGLVTFHGPVGRSTWSDQTVESFRQVLVRAGRLYLDPVPPDGFSGRRDGYRPIRTGHAEGPLVGGNLSVVSALAGTPYLPRFDGHVVFFEEVQEDIYRIDRMLTQLRLAGAFERAAAVVFGQCRSCATAEVPGDGLAWLLRDHFGAGARPAWTGAPIGHVSPVHTLPIGVPFYTDAALGTLVMQEPAVA
jgi:muramoyltetrapeptide carboxypeptidase